MKSKIFFEIYRTFSTSKPLFQKSLKTLNSEKNLCNKIQKISLQHPQKLFLNSLTLLTNKCEFIEISPNVVSEKFYEKIQKEIISSMKKETMENTEISDFEQINELLPVLNKFIDGLPPKLWQKTPLMSNLIKEILTKNISKLIQNFDELLSKKEYNNEHHEIILLFFQISRNLIKKNIIIFDFMEFCNKFLSKEEVLLRTPDVIVNFKTAILSFSFQKEKKNLNEIFSLLEKKSEYVLSNSKIISIIKTLEFFQKIEQSDIFNNLALNYLEKNLKTMDFLEIKEFIDLVLKSDKIKDSIIFALKNELNLLLISSQITNDETKLLLNLLASRSDNKNTRIFEMILNRNFHENPEFMNKRNIQIIFETHKIDKIDRNFINFLQKNYIPNLLNTEKEDFIWVIPILAIIFKRKLLNIPLLLSIERSFVAKKEETIKTMDLYNFSLFLYLLSENGFDESELFEIFEEFFLKNHENNKMMFVNNEMIKINDKNDVSSTKSTNLTQYIYVFKTSVHSIRKFSNEFYRKLFEIFENNFNFFIQKANIKEVSTFLRSLAVFCVSYPENEFNKMMESVLNSMENSGLLEKIIIKETEIKGNYFKIPLENFRNEFLVLEDFFKIYQFLFTFRTRDSTQNIFKIYDKIVETTNFKNHLTLINSALHVDVMEIIKRMKIPFVAEKQIKIYFIDIFIEPNLVIEVLGHKHFSRVKKIAKPKDILKTSHLKQMGFDYVEIPYFEFMESFFTEFEWRRKYVWDKIKDYMPEQK